VTVSDPGAPTNIDPAGFLANLVRGDVSATAALDIFRSNGLSMRTQTFYSLYGEIRDAVGGRSALQGMDYSQLPTGAQYTTYRAGEGGQYATFVQNYTRTVGTNEIQTRHYIHITNQPHTANEALTASASQFAEGGGGPEGPSGSILVGQTVSSMTVTVARVA